MKPINLILTFAVVFLAFTVKAQDKELGLFLGTTSYQGDLAMSHVELNETLPGFGLVGRYYFNPRLNFKGMAGLGWIEGSDKNSGSLNDPDANAASRVKRNLSFRSHVFELSGQLELNILPYISNSKKYRFSPYVFGGASLYNFNPQAKAADGKWYDLQPLGTEGQTLPGGKGKYSLWGFAIPYGVGIKYSLGNFWNLGLEVGQRKLFTDYLDDVSDQYADYDALNAQNPIAAQLSDRSSEVDPTLASNKVGTPRGDSKDLDMYVFAGFTITKTIRRFSCTNF